MKPRVFLNILKDYAKGERKTPRIKTLLRRIVGKPTPCTIQFDPTYHCNCDCAHCGTSKYKAPKRKELSLKETKNIIDQAEKIGTTRISFVGGEPGLRKDLPEIIRYAKQKGLFTHINTNGLLLEQKAREYKNAGIDQIYVSIDSADPKTHDKLRKHPGCFQKATRGITKSLSLGIDTRITTVARKKNLKEIPKIIQLGKKLGAAKVRILYPIPTGRLTKKDTLTKKQHQQVRKMLDGKYAFNPREDELLPGCGAGTTMININPYGDVKPCAFMPLVFGNLRQDSLEKIWERITQTPGFGKKTRECRLRKKDHEEWLAKIREWKKTNNKKWPIQGSPYSSNIPPDRPPEACRIRRSPPTGAGASKTPHSRGKKR